MQWAQGAQIFVALGIDDADEITEDWRDHYSTVRARISAPIAA